MSYHQKSKSGRTAASKSYFFPVLSIDEVLGCLAEMSIPASKEELQKPKADRVRTIFEALLEFCVGVSPDEIRQPAYGGLDAFQWPELHEESASVANFVRRCSKLLEVAGVSKFSVRDIIKPDPERLLVNLSAVINFAKFREDRLERYNELTAGAEKLDSMKVKLDEERVQLTSQLSGLKSSREKELPAIRAIEAECAELEAAINEKNKTQAILRHEVNEIKATISETKDANVDVVTELEELNREIEQLRSQIVSSPDRIRRELDALSTAAEDEKTAGLEVERQKREMAGRLETVERAERDISKLLGSVREVEDEATKHKDAVKAVKERKSRLDEHAAEDGEHTAHIALLEKTMKRAEDKTTEFRQTAEHRRRVAAKAIGDATSELASWQSRLASEEAAVKEAEAAKGDVLQERDAQRQVHADKLAAMKGAYTDLKASVDEYHSRLLHQMEQISGASL